MRTAAKVGLLILAGMLAACAARDPYASDPRVPALQRPAGVQMNSLGPGTPLAPPDLPGDASRVRYYQQR